MKNEENAIPENEQNEKHKSVKTKKYTKIVIAYIIVLAIIAGAGFGWIYFVKVNAISRSSLKNDGFLSEGFHGQERNPDISALINFNENDELHMVATYAEFSSGFDNSIPTIESLNNYCYNDSDSSVEKAVLNFFNAKPYTDEYSTGYNISPDKDLAFDCQSGRFAARVLFNLEYADEYINKYKFYSLVELEKKAFPTVQKAADEFENVLGVKLEYKSCTYSEQSVASDSTGGFLSITTHRSIPCCKYKFSATQKPVLDGGDNQKYPLLTNPFFDDGDSSEPSFYVTVTPDGQVFAIENEIMPLKYISENGLNIMFSAETIKKYIKDNINQLNVDTNDKDSRVVIDSLDSFYYDAYDFIDDEEKKPESGPRAIINYHLMSKNGKTYQFSIRSDYVEYGMLNENSFLSSDDDNFNENENNSQEKEDEEYISPELNEANITISCSKLGSQFGFYDANSKKVDTPYVYAIKQNPNAENLKEKIDSVMNVSWKESDNGSNSFFCNGNDGSAQYNTYTGVFETTKYLSAEKLKIYNNENNDDVDEKTLSKMELRKKADAVKKSLEECLGELTFRCFVSSVSYQSIGKKEYTINTYTFEYINENSSFSITAPDGKKYTPHLDNDLFRHPSLYITLYPDGSIRSIFNYSVTGFEKIKEVPAKADIYSAMTINELSVATVEKVYLSDYKIDVSSQYLSMELKYDFSLSPDQNHSGNYKWYDIFYPGEWTQ